MKKEDLIKRIKAQAKLDAKNRRDHRFLDAMGFLVTKGFLRANYPVPRLPNKKLFLEDVIWAGENVEPRILEVLPAAVLRLGAHFDLDPIQHEKLAEVVNALRNQKDQGPDFYGLPYKKLKAWANLTLTDQRLKSHADKKIPRTFRLSPKVIRKLKELAQKNECSETEALESSILRV